MFVKKTVDFFRSVGEIFFKKIKHVGVSKYRGTPKSSILIGFSIINHPFWGFSSIFGGNTHVNEPTISSVEGNSSNSTKTGKLPVKRRNGASRIEG